MHHHTSSPLKHGHCRISLRIHQYSHFAIHSFPISTKVAGAIRKFAKSLGSASVMGDERSERPCPRNHPTHLVATCSVLRDSSLAGVWVEASLSTNRGSTCSAMLGLH